MIILKRYNNIKIKSNNKNIYNRILNKKLKKILNFWNKLKNSQKFKKMYIKI